MDNFFSAAVTFLSLVFNQQDQVLGVSTPSQVLEVTQPMKTQSSFEYKFSTKSAILVKKTVYKDDPEVEAGEETVLDKGSDGKEVKTYKLTYFEGQQYDKELVSTQTVDTKDKIISRGTKIVWRTLDTPDGQISYWKRMRVYATHYDSHCPGCDAWTAIGMHQGKGVIAVDPSVIKLRSKVYVPGYGSAIAGDTGGAIRGNIIDLGFDNAHSADWTAHYIDIYLL